jgi:hypothetical protein
MQDFSLPRSACEHDKFQAYVKILQSGIKMTKHLTNKMSLRSRTLPKKPIVPELLKKFAKVGET